jgi:uncharacterized protein YprB with RNaseH-like and TPR domain
LLTFQIERTIIFTELKTNVYEPIIIGDFITQKVNIGDLFIIGMKFFCPYCKASYTFSAEYMEKKLECQKCKRRFEIAINTYPAPKQIFLDIETTGFQPTVDELTTVVWYGDGIWGHWVNNGMPIEQLTAVWCSSHELITFNGRKFDEPWLIKSLNFPRHPIHLDIMEESTEKGLVGGLKKIAEQLGMPRPAEFNEMEGKHAPKLWKSSQKGNKCSLCNLLYYNAWDVVMTYRLYCHLRGLAPESIEDTIPFGNNIESLRMFVKPSIDFTRKNNRKDNGKSIYNFETDHIETLPNSMNNIFICFTGDLERCEREEAEALVSSLGGTVKKSVVKRLDFLVIGDTGKYGKTNKISKAEEYISKGSQIKIINETEFWNIINQKKECI